MIGAWISGGRKVRKPSSAMPSTSAAQLRVYRARRAGCPPSAASWSSAASNATTMCVGGV